MGSEDGSGLETQVWDTLAFRQDRGFPGAVGAGGGCGQEGNQRLKEKVGCLLNARHCARDSRRGSPYLGAPHSPRGEMNGERKSNVYVTKQISPFSLGSLLLHRKQMGG